MVFLSKIIALYETRRLRDKKFVVVSNNCWGCDLYKSVRREYNMPFVGLFLEPDSYLKLLEDLEGNLLESLEFSKDKFDEYGYPVGVLPGGIYIHFMHYGSEDEARAKWERRATRLLTDMKKGVEVYVKFCGGDGCLEEHFERFTELPIKHKLALGVVDYNYDGYLNVANMQFSGKIFNGQKLFEYRYCYFDITAWILSGKIKKTWFSRFFGLLSFELFVYKCLRHV